MWLLPLLWLALVSRAVASFVDSPAIDIAPANVHLKPFVVYVAIDEQLKIMKFFINTEVVDPQNRTTLEPVITDVNRTTNRYTTLNVQIDFMGRSFVSENVRFCHALAVKNTSAYNSSARYHLASSSSSSAVSAPTRLPSSPNDIHNRGIAAAPGAPPDAPPGAGRRRALFGFGGGGPPPPPDANSTREPPPLLAYSNTSIDAFFANATGDLVQCPLYQNDSIVLYYQVNISDNVYKFGSYSAQFTVVSNGEDSVVIGGATSNVTPSIQPMVPRNVLFYGILALVLATYFINSCIIVLSPNQESANPFLIEASAICNRRLLEQLSASAAWFVSYLQFALFSVGLDIQYPGFLQYLMAKISWCALLNINLYHGRSINADDQYDNVFVNYHNGGVKALVSYASNSFIRYSWPNFMVCLAVWICFKLILTQAFISMKVVVSKRHSNSVLRKLFGFCGQTARHEAGVFTYSLQMNAWAIVGQFCRELLVFFAFPFLVLTTFMLRSASDPSSSADFSTQVFLESNAFNATVPYDVLQDSARSPASHLLPEALRHGGFHPHHFFPTPSIVMGTITVALWFGSVSFFVYHYLCPYTVTGKKNRNVAKLYTSLKTLVTWAYLYNQYEPSKVGYVVVDILGVVLPSLVVGVLQNYAKTQVILLLMVELLKLLLVVIIWPYYLEMQWHSMPCIMSAARVVVIFLNIPYIRELGASENTRTHVAYAQLFIHFFVCCYYIVHLIYCLGLTLVSVLRVANPERFAEEEDDVESSDGDGFQYQASTARHYRPKLETPALSRQSSNDVEYDYYRSKSENILKALEDAERQETQPETEGARFDTASITRTEDRIKQTDYTSREADKIYQKYFAKQEIDPEVKELWDKRDWATNPARPPHHAKTEQESVGFFARWSNKLNPPKPKGFEVVNRPPLKIKTQPGADD